MHRRVSSDMKGWKQGIGTDGTFSDTEGEALPRPFRQEGQQPAT